jgi:hypothetical protein
VVVGADRDHAEDRAVGVDERLDHMVDRAVAAGRDEQPDAAAQARPDGVGDVDVAREVDDLETCRGRGLLERLQLQPGEFRSGGRVEEQSSAL